MDPNRRKLIFLTSMQIFLGLLVACKHSVDEAKYNNVMFNAMKLIPLEYDI